MSMSCKSKAALALASVNPGVLNSLGSGVSHPR